MIYSVDLTIPSSPLTDYSILNHTSDFPEIFFAKPTDVDKHFTEWLDSQGLVMTYPPLIFYTPPGQQCGIHIDGYGVTDRACVNFILGGVGSLMHWYKLRPEVELPDQSATQAGTPYTLYEPDQVEHVYSHAVKWPSIVQTGVPHNITNHTHGPRWCISCDISYKDTPEAGLTMAQALEVFKKWIL
jgi:hypothetical protein